MMHRSLTAAATTASLISLASCAIPPSSEGTAAKARMTAPSAQDREQFVVERSRDCLAVTPKTLPSPPPVRWAPSNLVSGGESLLPPVDAPSPSVRGGALAPEQPRSMRVKYVHGSAAMSLDAMSALARALDSGRIESVSLRGSTSGDRCATANRRLVSARVESVRRYIAQQSPKTAITVEAPSPCPPTGAVPTPTQSSRDRHVDMRIVRAPAVPSPTIAVNTPKESP